MKNSYSKITTLALILLIAVSQNLMAQTSVKPIVRLVMTSASFNDETVFYFEQGGTTAFQPSFDAYKLVFGSVPYLGSMSDSILTSISGLPELTANISVPVKAITPASGNFTFSSVPENFPADVCVTLFDAFTGITTNILTNEYSCMLYDTTSVSRFKISFYTTSFQAVTSIHQPVCGAPESGIISATAGNGPWNYEWKNGDSVVKTSLNKTAPDSLLQLAGGNYSVKISSIGGCGHFTKSFYVNPVITPTASFTPDVFKTSLSNTGQVNFTNHSEGSQFNAWDFGDNSGTWYIPSPSYNYSSPGTYTVTLVSESITHCKDTAYQVIQVVGGITGISTSVLDNEVRLATLSQGNYALNMSFDKATTIEINVFDLNGNLLTHNDLGQITQASQVISLNGFSQGMYLVKLVTDKNAEKTFKLIN